jgi:hypothetical protein
MKRSVSSTQLEAGTVNSRHWPAGVSDDECLASAVMSNIEDGNIQAAVRIITSDYRHAADSAETVQAIIERHPSAAAGRQQNPDPLRLQMSPPSGAKPAKEA